MKARAASVPRDRSPANALGVHVKEPVTVPPPQPGWRSAKRGPTDLKGSLGSEKDIVCAVRLGVESWWREAM